MRAGFLAAMGASLVLLTLAAGCAISPESRLHVTAMASFIDDDPERGVDEGLSGYQIGVGKSLGDNYKLEVAAVGSRMDADGFDADQRQQGLKLDIMRKLGSSSYFYPYAVLGLGHLQTDRLGPDGRDYNGPMVSLGAGVITPFYIMGQAVRIEMRLRNDSGDTEGARYQDALLSIGLHFPLGRPATLRPDSDGDGVDDARDKCERTRVGAVVDKYGCARDIDSDKDGVSDAIDMCGGTQAGRVVDEYGCERSGDSDADGVPDYRDRCPQTRSGMQVDADGCEVNATTRLRDGSSEPSRFRAWSASSSTRETMAPLPQQTRPPIVHATGSTLRGSRVPGPRLKFSTGGSAFTLTYALAVSRPQLSSVRPRRRSVEL